MSTLTTDKWNGITATVTYSVSSTNDKTTLTVTKAATTSTNSSSVDYDIQVIADGTTLYNVSIGGADPHTWSYTKTVTKTWNRSTSASSKSLQIRVGYASDSWWPSSKSTTVSVPALPTYTVSYNANSHGTAPASQTKTYGVSLTLRGAITASGYSFKRWNTNSTDTGTGYNASAAYTGNAAVTLYAIWNRTVTYHANGGSNAPAAQTAIATSAITITTSKPTRDGYEFKQWNTKSDGTGTAYSPGGSYAAQAASITLYAIWVRSIGSVTIGAATAKRVGSSSSTEPEDEGTYAYIEVPYTVTGSAAGTVSMTMTATAESGSAPSVTLVSSSATKTAGNTLTGTFVARASGCDANVRYTFNATVTAKNTSETQADVVVVRAILLPTAFYTMDVKAGGHGISFGSAAIEDVFNVSMPITFHGQPAGLVFFYSSLPAESAVPYTPCFVYCTADSGLYYYSG